MLNNKAILESNPSQLCIIFKILQKSRCSLKKFRHTNAIILSIALTKLKF